jgi:nitroreductase
MTKDKALELALEAMKLANSSHNMVLTSDPPQSAWRYHNVDMKLREAISAIKAALEAKDEPYAFEASMYPRVIIDPVTGNVSIGTVTKACGLECDCTDVCKQDDYKALWQQMCERCEELDKKLAQRKPLTDDEIKEAVLDNPFGGLALLSMMRDEVMIADVRQAINRIARAIEAAHGIKGEA